MAGLKELNRILGGLGKIDQRCWTDDEISWRIGYLSEEIRESKECIDFIQKALKLEEGVRHRKISVENKRIVDLESNQCASTVEKNYLMQKLVELGSCAEDASYALVHVASSIPDEEKRLIVDRLKRQMPRTQLKAFFTNKELFGKTVVEAVYFGSFPDDSI